MGVRFLSEDLILDPTLSDTVVIERVRRGETALFEVLIRRLNQRLYRIVRAILGDDADVADVLQETYVSAYSCLDQFVGRAKPSTWIVRIAIHAAYARTHRRELERTAASEAATTHITDTRDPEQVTSGRELARLVERAVDSLPEADRVVFVMREIEQLDTAESARLLAISQEAVRVRLHRARAMLRETVRVELSPKELFAFHRFRCDSLTEAVLRQLLDESRRAVASDGHLPPDHFFRE